MMRESLDTFISPVQRASIRASIAEARTLPRQAFTSEAFFALEQERIFNTQWLALCFAQQLPQPGCLLPLEFAGIPLLVVHGDDGKLRVFHNIVPYDGCLAVIGTPADVPSDITTPYHGWRYDLRGKLIAIPFWDGNAQGDLAALRGRCGDLVEIPSQTELGILFINLNGKADPFDVAIQPLRHILSDYRTDDLAIGQDEDGQPLIDTSENLATNWKTHYENWAINVLHEGFTHEIYAESPQIPRVNTTGEKTYVEHMDGSLMALSYRERDFAETYELDEVPFTHLGIDPEHLPEHAYIGSLFPNLHFAAFPYFIHFIIALPVSAGQTLTLRAQLYDAASAANPDYLEERLGILADFQQAGQEDGRITEAVQKARRSPAFEQQFYAPFWDRMHYNFSNQVLDVLENTDKE
ncbi:aromatic ring-hydroxylating oxygenase subunit alpha [Thiothrix lacustris]|uniref:aromatic ring-hydroxylating oxygenase subunit alpha n=1 Tax=Thiothrix lacustris TaxID=525917 RepID=UPI0027E51869|nr:SRPBCC family protein [Thiothrix lacustris]WMP19427.1 SRPBCC family protein [Thiothrix lacustris]